MGPTEASQVELEYDMTKAGYFRCYPRFFRKYSHNKERFGGQKVVRSASNKEHEGIM